MKKFCFGLVMPLLLGAAVFFSSSTPSFAQQSYGNAGSRVIIGVERLFTPEFLPLLKGKRIAVLTNHTGLLPDKRHLVDVLFAQPDMKLVKLFSPEHGIRGEEDNHVADAKDPKTGLPIISLYGKLRKPTPAMLQEVDVLLFDIQDVGARYYTYIATMTTLLEAAAENNKLLLVLDRPNPITGVQVGGNVGSNAFKEVTGPNFLPIVHGMTVGELATMFNGQRAAKGLPAATLKVIPLQNYTRQQWFDQTALPWIKPSPNMINLTTATVYPATCILEGTNVSEGRGTMQPFEYIGSPWINGEQLAMQLNSYQLPGVTFKPVQFKPDSVVDGIRIYPPKFVGQVCHGAKMIVTDRNAFAAANATVYIMHALHTLYPTQLEWKNSRLDGLWKTDTIRKRLKAGDHPKSIVADWEKELAYFKKVRAQYLLYP